jgi:carbon monoxide dehydrogenase subunit G
MNKVVALLLVLVALTSALTDKEIIQTGLNGLFEQNQLPDPTTIVTCVDDDTAHKLVVFAGQVFAKAASGSPSDMIALIKLVKDFGSQIPKSVTDCLQNNKEALALGLKYGITPDTDESVIEKKIITYVTLHYLQVHGWFGDLNTLWTSGEYYKVGYNGAGYLHKVLGASTVMPLNSDKDNLQQVLNGLFEANKLPDPTTIMPCIDDDTAHKIVVFAGELLDKASKASPSDIIKLVQLIKDFGDQIPKSVTDCLDGNQEFETLGTKYGITPDTDPSVIEKKVLTYVALHYLEVHKELGDLNTMWVAGKFYQMGYEAANYGHKILGSTYEMPNPTDKEILQEALNGLFEQNKLPKPTTVMPCIDDATAHKIVVFLGQLLEKAAKGSPSDISQIVSMVKAFGDQIPQSVKDCLKGNQEFDTLGRKYGITPETDTSALGKKVIAYVTLHYLTVHKWLGSLNGNWKGGKYYQVGFDAAGYGHSILGITIAEIANLRRSL